jgi:hypothetical protein
VHQPVPPAVTEIEKAAVPQGLGSHTIERRRDPCTCAPHKVLQVGCARGGHYARAMSAIFCPSELAAGQLRRTALRQRRHLPGEHLNLSRRESREGRGGEWHQAGSLLGVPRRGWRAASSSWRARQPGEVSSPGGRESTGCWRARSWPARRLSASGESLAAVAGLHPCRAACSAGVKPRT